MVIQEKSGTTRLFFFSNTDLNTVLFLSFSNFCSFISLVFLNSFPFLLLVAKPTITHKCTEVYYKHSIRPTCFSHSCGHPKGDALKKMGNIVILQTFVEQCTDVTHILLYAFVSLATKCNCSKNGYDSFPLIHLYSAELCVVKPHLICITPKILFLYTLYL